MFLNKEKAVDMCMKSTRIKEANEAVTMQPTLDKEVAIFQKVKFTSSSLA